MKTLEDFINQKAVYGRKDGMWVCGVIGHNLRLSTDKTLAVSYIDSANTRAFAAEKGIALIPATKRLLCD